MPIVSAKPTAPTTVKPNIPRIEAPEHKSNVVDTSYVPASSLLTYVEGSSWTVDYYSQVIDNDNALAGQDVGQSGVYQQYKVIRKLELKVSGALTSSQDNSSKSFIASGSAHLHSLVIPNEGDMFLADVGDGREGVFQISLSEKKNIFKESVYYIEYQLIYYSDQDKPRRNDLENKVVQELHYLKDFLQHGQNPLVTTNQFEAINELKYKYQELIDNYFRWFFSNEFKTLMVPGQISSVYDHFVTTFMASILTTRDNDAVRHMRKLNVDDDYYLDEPNLFTAMLKRDNSALKTGVRKTGLVSTASFSSNPRFEGIRFTGIKYIVYPKDHTPVYDSHHNRMDKVISDEVLERVNSRTGSISSLIYDQTIQINSTAVKTINSVLADEHYVLSQNFYDELVNQSALEVLVRNYFQDERNDPVVLLKVAGNYANWGGLERFYYIPLLLALIRDCVRSI